MRPARVLTLAEAYGFAGGLVAGAMTALAAWAGFSSGAAVIPVAIVTGMVVAAGARDRQSQRVLARRSTKAAAAASRNLEERIEERIASLQAELREVRATAAFSAVEVPYPLPLGGFALDYEAAAILAREVATTRPAWVVELGSGASTLVIGLQLKRSGIGHLYALEHEPFYAERTRRHVRALGLEAVVSVLDAPLVPVALGAETYNWYQVPGEVASIERVDLLLVDGPPQATDRHGTPRYPALPVFSDQLAPGSVVMVDDAGRGAEQRMLERWHAERPDLVRETIPTRHGVAILRASLPG